MNYLGNESFWVTVEIEGPLGEEKRWRGVKLLEADWPILAERTIGCEGMKVRHNRSRGQWLVTFWRSASDGGHGSYVTESREEAVAIVRKHGPDWNELADQLARQLPA